MKRTIAMLLVAAAWLGIGSSGPLSLAQPPQAQPLGRQPPPPGYVPPVDARFRDPTQPSAEMRAAIEAAQAMPGPAPGATAAAAPAMPQIKLKARLMGTLAPPVAMLDVNGRMLVTHQGEEATIANPGGGTSTIIVRELSAAGVTIEILPLKKIVNLQ